MKSREQNVSDLSKPNTINKFKKSYMKIEEEQVVELIRSRHNVDKLRQILIKMTGEQWLENILEAYDAVVMSLAEQIINEYPELVRKVEGEEYKIGDVAIDKKDKPTVIKPFKVPRKTISVTTKGKTYTRSRTSWSKKEEVFVQTRMSLPMKELKQQFATKFGVMRSTSSLGMKRHRLKNIEGITR